jgi:hypothetical protein
MNGSAGRKRSIASSALRGALSGRLPSVTIREQLEILYGLHVEFVVARRN